MRNQPLSKETRKVAIALCSLLASSVSFGQETWPIRRAEEKVLAGLNQQCVVLEEEIELGKEFSLGLATSEAQYAIQCKCLPSELGKAVDAHPKDALITQESFSTLVRESIETCVGRTMRAKLLEMCNTPDNKDIDESDRPRYCACMRRGLEALSDEQLYQSAEVGFRNFEAKVKTAREGKPPTTPEESVVSSLSSSCKKP